MLLADDVGGTKTDLAIFSAEGGPHLPLIEAKAHTADYPSSQAPFEDFLDRTKIAVDRVVNGQVKVTNLPRQIDQVSLARDLNLKFVHLLNDAASAKTCLDVRARCGRVF